MLSIHGRVDGVGRALLRITLRRSPGATPVEIEAWLDTGFTGELVLPEDRVSAMGLSRTGTVTAGLGDGTRVLLDTYSCFIEWFGQMREIQIVAGTGQFPLLGIGLLRNHKVTVDFASAKLTVE